MVCGDIISRIASLVHDAFLSWPINSLIRVAHDIHIDPKILQYIRKGMVTHFISTVKSLSHILSQEGFEQKK